MTPITTIPTILHKLFLWAACPFLRRAAVVYVVRDGLVLSVSRKGTGEAAAPGGKLDPGDEGDAARAVRRELREEAGVEALTLSPVYRGWHGRWLVDAFMGTIAADAEPRAVEPGTTVAWVAPAVLANGYAPRFHTRALRAAGLMPASSQSRAG